MGKPDGNMTEIVKCEWNRKVKRFVDADPRDGQPLFSKQWTKISENTLWG